MTIYSSSTTIQKNGKFPPIFILNQFNLSGAQASALNLREYEYKWVVYNQGMVSSHLADKLDISDNIIIVEDASQTQLEREAKDLLQVIE